MILQCPFVVVVLFHHMGVTIMVWIVAKEDRMRNDTECMRKMSGLCFRSRIVVNITSGVTTLLHFHM